MADKLTGLALPKDAKKVQEIVSQFLGNLFESDGVYRQNLTQSEDYILQDSPHERNAGEFDFLNYELVFKEVMRISGKQQKTPSDANNTDSRDWGYQEPKEVSL